MGASVVTYNNNNNNNNNSNDDDEDDNCFSNTCLCVLLRNFNNSLTLIILKQSKEYY